jgi:hypothetical protein
MLTAKQFEIFAELDAAETWQYSRVLDWGHVSFSTLKKFVNEFPLNGGIVIESFDVLSVQSIAEEWWKENAYPTPENPKA